MRHPALFFTLCFAPVCSAQSPADSLHRVMKEVKVQAGHAQTLRDNGEGRIYWDMASLEDMPHLLGTADPLRCLQLLPGVSTNNDYSAGIHVQGCSPAHTLLEIDGAPVFNPSHLLGLFSVLTPSHFRGMSLTKSRHGASFGDYLGGHLVFHPTDSIARALHLNATISFMESEGTLTLPAGRNSTLYVSARGSYLNLLYGDLMDIDEMKMDYGLQDYNLTYIVKAGERDKLQFNFYHGKDRTTMLQKDFQSNMYMNWQNTLGSLNWLHGSRRSIMRQSAFLSRYTNEMGLDIGSIHLDQTSEIFQAGYKGSIQHTARRTEWNAGLAYDYTVLRPMGFRVYGSFLQNENPAVREEAHEAAAYADVKFRLSSHVSIESGLRLSAYLRNGNAYVHPAPRITVQWQPASPHSLFLHYGMYHQYLHRITLSNCGMPIDFWTSSSPSARPEEAHSVTAGYRFVSPRNTYEVGIEVYYKQLKGQYEYHGSILDIVTQTYDMARSLSAGNGRNYGMDILLKRNRGRLTGWLSYSLSRSKRQYHTDNSTQWYNSAFERRHDLSVVAEYKLTPHWSVGGDFVYASGTPYTGVRSMYMLNLNLVNEYGKHNGSHLPPTHRMDLSLTYRFARHKKTEQSLNLSVFNVYAHRNVLFRYMDFKENHYGYRSVYSLCRILPSIGYSIKF